MPVQVQWYEAPHVIVSFWSGDVDEGDMEQFSRDIRVLFAEAEAPVYLLADTDRVTKPFMNMGSIRTILKGIMDDERLAELVAYNVTIPIINFLITVLMRAFSVKARSFESWKSAQAYLTSLNTGLDFSRQPTPSENPSENSAGNPAENQK